VLNPKNIKVIVPEAKVYLLSCLKEIEISALSLASSNVISFSVELEGETLSETSSCGLSLEVVSFDVSLPYI